jgi:hypothetical protein
MTKDISANDCGKGIFVKGHCVYRSDADRTSAFRASRYTRALIAIQSQNAKTRHDITEHTEEAAGSAASIKNEWVFGVGQRLS